MRTPEDPTTIVCTAADAGYFGLLRDLVTSLEKRAADQPHVLGVLDLGLSAEQQAWLADKGARLVVPGWDFDFPSRAEQPEHFRSQIARAFLPKHFPGFEVYVWLDSDTWVQDGAVIKWLVHAAQNGTMAVTEELHQAYDKVHDQKDLVQKYTLIRQCFSQAEADQYGLTPSVNSGVFAMRGDAPHWAIWGEEMRQFLHRFNTRFVDQLTLERVVHAHRLPVTYMPARANWVVSQATPAFCPDRGMLVEPLPPYDPIWLLHLTLGSKDIEFPIPMTDGRQLYLNLRLSNIGPLVGIF